MEDSSQGAHGVGWGGAAMSSALKEGEGHVLVLLNLGEGYGVWGALVREAKKHFGFLLRVLECSWVLRS